MTMRKCTRCLVPETVDTISFDEEGVCSVCRQVETKKDRIDWADRQRQLDAIIEEYKGKDLYDCIVPYSGGKDSVFQLYPDLVSITLLAPTDDPATPDDPDAARAPEAKVPDEPLPDARKPPVLGHRDRGFPVDKATERELSVVRPLDKREGGPSLKVVFAADRKTLDHITEASEFLATYRLLNREKKAIDQAFFKAYLAAGFGVSLFAALIGRVLARYVTRRIEALAAATQAVGAGDLTVRVPVEGQDELTDLARAFNRMLGELTESRARIEFLGKMGTWQEMARRLAHEIKNPLTPIQLAVQECHLRYDGSNRSFRKLLDTTREIVEEEVGTLRRLVTEFSNFARLPRASLEEGDLTAYLREQREKLAVTEGDGEDEAGLLQGVVPRWSLPARPIGWVPRTVPLGRDVLLEADVYGTD